MLSVAVEHCKASPAWVLTARNEECALQIVKKLTLLEGHISGIKKHILSVTV